MIRGGRQLLTLRGASGPRRGAALQHLGLIEDGAVLIEEGMIREVGPTRRLENLASTSGASTIEARGCVVMPGFVDCHAHLISGHRANLAARGHDASLILPWVENVRRTPVAQLVVDAADTLKRASAHGTTTMGAVGGFGLDERTELKILRAYRSLPRHPVQVVPSYYGLNLPPSRTGYSSYVTRVCTTVLPTVERRHLADFAHAACGAGHFDSEGCRRFAECAHLGVRIDYAPDGPAPPLSKLLHPRVTSVEHLEFAEPADLRSLADSEALAVLLPATSFYLDSGRFGHGRLLADTGAAIALGSDFNRATAPGSSMQFAIWLACRRMNLNIAEAVNAATINAACALGLDHAIGSIEPGKQADILILQIPDHRALASKFGMNLIGMTIKDGEIVYRSADFA